MNTCKNHLYQAHTSRQGQVLGRQLTGNLNMPDDMQAHRLADSQRLNYYHTVMIPAFKT